MRLNRNFIIKLLLPFIIFFVLFLVFAAIISTLMELKIVKSDLGPIHRYISNFNARSLLVSCICLLVFCLSVIKKWLKNYNFVVGFFLVLVILFFDTLGNLFGYYSVGASYSVWWYDNFTHTLIALIMVPLFHMMIKGQNNSNIKAFLSMMLSSYIGTLWEIYEYVSDRFLHTYMVGGVEDVATDLIYNNIGALLGFVFVIWVLPKIKISK